MHCLLRPLLLPLATALVGALLGAPAQAERPRAVDNAVVAPKGSMRLETWASRSPSHAASAHLGLAWVPLETLELGALASRDRRQRLTTTGLQLKWSMTPAQRDGCQLATLLGLARNQGHSGHQQQQGTSMSCNDSNGAMHFNVGRSRAAQGPWATTWGVSIEFPDGSYTGFAEAFGQRGPQERTTYQLGLRAALTPAWQIDGSWGRERESRAQTYSLGLAYRF